LLMKVASSDPTAACCISGTDALDPFAPFGEVLLT
jgi:hypothetical protein